MTRRLLLCLGNRQVADDDAGPRVFDLLRARPELVGDDVELIDGGLAGLDLIGQVDGAERVIFIDHVEGFGAPGEVLTLSAEQVCAQAEPTPRHDHAGGLPFLLRCLPVACDQPPELLVVGLEGVGVTQEAVDRAARLGAALVGAEERCPP